MAMKPELWSVNGLSTETGIDRRTLARYLGTVEPAGEGRHGPLYRMRDLIEALRNVHFISLAYASKHPFHQFGLRLRRAFHNGLAERLIRSETPAAAARIVLELYADTYYRAVYKDLRGPDPPTWDQANGQAFRRAIAALLSPVRDLEDVVRILERGRVTPAMCDGREAGTSEISASGGSRVKSRKTSPGRRGRGV